MVVHVHTCMSGHNRKNLYPKHQYGCCRRGTNDGVLLKMTSIGIPVAHLAYSQVAGLLQHLELRLHHVQVELEPMYVEKNMSINVCV